MLKLFLLFSCLISIALCVQKTFQLPTVNVIPDWNNDTHWNPQGVPTENDDITIVSINSIDVPSGITIKSLSVQGTTTVVFSGEVNITESISFVGISAVLDVNGTISGTGVINGGTIKVQTNARIEIPATGTKVNFFTPPGGYVAKLINPPADGGIQGASHFGELVLGGNLGVTSDRRNHEPILTDTLTVTANIVSNIDITVNNNFDVNHTIELWGETTFLGNVRFGSGQFVVTDTTLTIEGTTYVTAPLLQIDSNTGAKINFYGPVDIDPSVSTDIGSGTVDFRSSVNGNFWSSNAIYRLLPQSTVSSLSKLYAKQITLQASTTYPSIGAVTSVDITTAGATINELNAPPTVTIEGDVSVGSFWAKEQTPLTINGAHLITVTEVFNVSSSQFTSEANITLVEGASGVFNNEQITITLSAAFFTNRGNLKFVGGADILLGEGVDFVNYGTLTFSATTTSVISFNGVIEGITPGQFVNLGLVLTNGYIQLLLNDTVSYYQCPTGEFEIEPMEADALGFAYFSYEAVLLGKIVADFPSSAVLDATTPGLVIATWVRSQNFPPVGSAELKVEVATATVATAALCLDPVSDTTLGAGSVVYLKIWSKDAPAAGGDTCKPFKSDAIPPNNRYCPPAPAPSGQSPQPSSNPPSTTGPVTPPSSDPPSSGGVQNAITTSLVLMAMSVVF